MKRLPDQSARYVAQKAEARMAIVLTLGAHGDYGIVSYGRRISEGEAAKELGDRLAGMLQDGTLAHLETAIDGTDLQSLGGRVQKLSELLAQVIDGHGGESCPFGPLPCVRCRVAREWKAYENGAGPKPKRPKRKRCAIDGCKRTTTGALCTPCKQEHRRAMGLKEKP